MMPGWAMPPSMGALPNYPSANHFAPPGVMRPHPMGSLTERLGSTLRLGVDLLNAALARGTSMLGGGAMQWDAHGCGCDRCGHDCCDAMSAECCRPGAHGCGCC